MWGKIDTTEVVLQIWNKDMSIVQDIQVRRIWDEVLYYVADWGELK